MHRILMASFVALVILATATLPAFAQSRGSRLNAFFSINMSTGALTQIGCVNARGTVEGLALAGGSTAYAITTRNRVVTFDVNAPASPISDVAITGLGRGESLIGIDIRPATGVLYGVSNRNVVYTLDPASGAATAVGGAFSPGISGSAIGFDFNPTVDRIRLVTDRGQNLRLNPDTGAVAAVDKNLAFAGGGSRPTVSGAGYTNSVAGATSTELLVIDTRTDVLALQAPPNDGALTPRGSLGVSVTSVGGFDILPSGQGFVVARASVRC